MKKVLIMGGSYFIGKHIVNRLKQLYEVYVLNRGNQPFNDARIHELICDRNDADKLADVLAPYTFQYVVDISGYTKAHAEALLNALDLSQLERFVYISTSAVYNKNILTPPFSETDVLGGDSPFKDYAANKIAAEATLINHLNKNQWIVLRPPIVYGEDNYILRERLAFHLIEHAMPIYVPRSDNQLSFVYVKDLAQDVHLSLEGAMPAGIYNVGHRQPLSFSAWVNLCGKVMNKKASIVYVDATHPSLDIRHFFPFFDYDNILSVAKIKHYAPNETSIELGLANAYQDYVSIKETIQIPEKMQAMRARIDQLLMAKVNPL